MLKRSLPDEEVTRVWRMISGSISENIYEITSSLVSQDDVEFHLSVGHNVCIGGAVILEFAWTNAGYESNSIDAARNTLLKTLSEAEEKPLFEVRSDYIEILSSVKEELISNNIFELKEKSLVTSKMVLFKNLSSSNLSFTDIADFIRDEELIDEASYKMNMLFSPLLDLYPDVTTKEERLEDSIGEDSIEEIIAHFCRARYDKLTYDMSFCQGYKNDTSEFYKIAVENFYDGVASDVLNRLLLVHPFAKAKYFDYLQNPSKCGFDLKKQPRYLAGELYAFYQLAVKNETADPYVCSSLNAFQKRLIDNAARGSKLT